MARTTKAKSGSTTSAFAQCPPGKEFIFRMPSGSELARARNVGELRNTIERAPLESVLYHTNGGHFVPWLNMLGEHQRASNISQVKGSGELVRRTLVGLLEK